MKIYAGQWEAALGLKPPRAKRQRRGKQAKKNPGWSSDKTKETLILVKRKIAHSHEKNNAKFSLKSTQRAKFPVDKRCSNAYFRAVILGIGDGSDLVMEDAATYSQFVFLETERVNLQSCVVAKAQSFAYARSEKFRRA